MAKANPAAKAKLVSAAQELMLAKGYAATSVDDICAKAGRTKGSFFYYFQSKEKLALAALDWFAGDGFEMVRQAHFHRRKDPLDRVFGYVDFMIQMSQDPSTPESCLVGNLAQEVSDTHPALRGRCAHHFGAWAEGLRRELEAAKKFHSTAIIPFAPRGKRLNPPGQPKAGRSAPSLRPGPPSRPAVGGTNSY